MNLVVSLRRVVGEFELDVSFEAKPGITVLFGYSGAGKSMTLQSISGLIEPDIGHVRLGNNTFFDSEKGISVPPQDRSVGCVFQNLALFPHFTVEQNIAHGALKRSGRKKTQRTVEELAHRLNLTEHLKKRIWEISGGQQQRVALARALAREPKLLLLDEPFSALDNPLRMEMRRCLNSVMHSLSIPVLLVTHDFEEAMEMADSLAVFSMGRVVQQGTPVEVVNKPSSLEVARLVNKQTFKPSWESAYFPKVDTGMSRYSGNIRRPHENP